MTDSPSSFEELAMDVANNIKFSGLNSDMWLVCRRDVTDPQNGRLFYQVHCNRPDTFTGKMDTGHGGKAYLSEHMVESELTQLAFGLFLRYAEHEVREGFTYHGKRVYGPHLNVRRLMEIADDIVVRP